MTKTEELKREIVEILARAEPNTCGAIATQILQSCKEAGLAFVKEDAELPRNLWQGDFGYGYAQGRQDMLEAKFRQFEEIELT